MKKLLALCTSLAMALSLAACATGNAPAPEADSAPAPASQPQSAAGEAADEPAAAPDADEVVITLAEHVANIENQSPHVAKIVNGFMAQNPRIDIQMSGSEVSEHITKMKLAAQGNDLPDIIWLEQPVTREMAAAGYLYDMTDALEEYGINDMLLPGLVNACTYEGRDYGLPSEIMMVGFFYNKAIFEEHGLSVPESFEDFIVVCEALAAAGVTPIAKGSQSNFSVWAFQAMLARYGFFEKLDGLLSGEESWVNEDFIHFYEKVAEMREAGAFGDNVTNMDYFQATQEFLAGNAAMFDSGAWEVNTFEDSDIAGDVGFFWGPTFADGVGEQRQAIKTSGGVYVISAKAAEDPDKLDAIMEFFRFYYGEEGTRIIAEETLNLPTTRYDSSGIDAGQHPVFVEMVNRLNDDWQSSREPFSWLSTNVGNTMFDSIWGVINGIYSPEQAAQAVEDALALER